MPIVNLPDGSRVVFPETMDVQEIESILMEVTRSGSENPKIESPVGQVRQEQQSEPGIVDRIDQGIATVTEPLATIVTGAIAEPLAGLAGMAQSLNPFAEERAGEKAINAVREVMTFKPRTEAGKKSLQAVATVLAPIGQALDSAGEAFGNDVFEVTGSSALAALASTAPTLLAEVATFGTGKGAGAIKRAAKTRKVNKAIQQAAPTVDQLKDTSRAVYREIDEMGAVVSPEAYQSLVSQIEKSTIGQGLDHRVTPKAAGALNAFKEVAEAGRPVTLTELNKLHRMSSNLAKSSDIPEASLGLRMIDEVDSFLDNAGTKVFQNPDSITGNVAVKYKIARNLWGRARRSELIEEAFERARNQATGFENGIRVQFRSILNNKKRSRFFNAEELAAMKKVVRGTGKENLAKFIGKVGLPEGGASNLVGVSIGIAGGSAAFGAGGGAIVPIIGTVSKKLAQRMTAKNAEFADAVIRAGKDAKKIVQAYIDNTPRQARSAQELSELLMRPDIELGGAGKLARLGSDASKIALENRKSLVAAGAVPGVLESVERGNSENVP